MTTPRAATPRLLPRTSSHLSPGILAGLALLAFGLPATADGIDPPTAEKELTPATSGFLYGIVETRSGNFEGRLRWKRRDAFWSDFLQSTKEHRPYMHLVPIEERIDTNHIEIAGTTVASTRRIARHRRGLVARYGDVERIEVHNNNWSTLVMRDGSEIELSGGRDFRSTISIYGADGSQTELSWRRILRIRFLPTPAGLDASIHRMYGTVKTSIGDLTGFVQWDQEEGTSEDLIDGHERESRDERSLALGDIKSIEKIDRDSSRFVLHDGEVVELYGTNDVNHQNRGIWVELPEWGRLAVSWQAFERVDFAPPPGSGPSYDDFDAGRPLIGTVTTSDGTSHRGRLVYDIDEAFDWDFFNAEAGGIDYDIPFALIRSVERLSDAASRVTLKSGDQVELSGSSDAGRGHDGLLVFDSAEVASFVPWRQVRRVDFEDALPDSLPPAP